MHSHLEDEIAPQGSAVYVAVFLIIAVFILLIACINFMNLSTARSARRAKEVGVRKVMALFGQKETRPMEIIGLLQEFHFESLHQPIRPLVLRVAQGVATYLLLRVQGNTPDIIRAVELQWASFTGGQPFLYFFLRVCQAGRHRQPGRVAHGLLCHATLAGELCLSDRTRSLYVSLGRCRRIAHCDDDGELSCAQGGVGEPGGGVEV